MTETTIKAGDAVEHIGSGWTAVVERIVPGDDPLEAVAIFTNGGFWRVSQLMSLSQPLFYICDTRSSVGNSILWWREGGHGYTCNLDEAWKVPGSYRSGRDTDVLVPCAKADAMAERHVDMQRLRL